MKQLVGIVITVLMVAFAQAQHTFSIVALDSLTGEVGSAGATCGDSIIWPGTKGALVISDVLPGVGAIHTQASWNFENQLNARSSLENGLSPKTLIEWLENNDVGGDNSIRQYGIVAWHNNRISAAAYTGNNCLNFKGHRVGPNYAIQGNILKGPQILDSMEARFLRKKGPLASRLMAAMQGANVVGADSRCTDEGTSSLSAFLRVAKKDDQASNLFLDINVAGTGKGVEPIDVLQEKFNKWRIMNGVVDSYKPEIQVYPNPSTGSIQIQSPIELSNLTVYNSTGKIVRITPTSGNHHALDLSSQPSGIYLVIGNSVKSQYNIAPITINLQR